MKAHRPTSADVAERAGVSRATVSYVLNNAPHQAIPEATRQRVLAAVRELDYTPHAAARALRAGTSRLVLLVNTGVPYGTNLSIMIDALDSEVAAGGRSLVVWQQRAAQDLAATLAHLQPVVAIVLGRLTAEQRVVLTRARQPYVEADPATEDDQGDLGAVLQVRHLAARGHRRIGHLTTTEPELAMFAEARLTGVRTACADLNLAPAMVAQLPGPADLSVTALAATLTTWTTGPEPVTGLACYNDSYAAAGLAAADRAGIPVPETLAVVGMDDEAMSAFSRPALTTVRLHMVEYAQHLWAQARSVLPSGRASTGAPPPDSSAGVHFSLVVRAST